MLFVTVRFPVIDVVFCNWTVPIPFGLIIISVLLYVDIVLLLRLTCSKITNPVPFALNSRLELDSVF